MRPWGGAVAVKLEATPFFTKSTSPFHPTSLPTLSSVHRRWRKAVDRGQEASQQRSEGSCWVVGIESLSVAISNVQVYI
jgi:hypothetical protein